MGLSSAGGSSANTSYNGNDSGVRTRFDQIDGGGGSGAGTSTNGVADHDSTPNFTKRLLSFRNHNIATAAPAQPSVSVLDSSQSKPN